MDKTTDVLLCYRGRFQAFVRALAEALRKSDLRVAFDREILAEPASASDLHREVEWVSVGDEQQGDVAWRAPIRTAVERAEMVAFAVAFPDVSENVVNEMQWAIKSGVHTFVLIHEGPTNLETQGLAIGMLGIQYMLATGGPEYPEFGYHFCGSLEGADLGREATVAAHRIAAHLARCRAGALRTLSAADAGTLADLAQRPEARARRFLRGLQAGLHREAAQENAPEPTPAMQAAREHLEQREADFIGVKAPAGRIEQFRRADDILNRCRPGPHEAAAHIGPLILEAGAIEMVLHSDLRAAQPQALDFQPGVFLGTVPASNVIQPWSALAKDDLRVLIVDAAFLDFQYQMLKLSIFATAVPAADANGRQGLRLDFEHLPGTLAAQPQLLDDGYRCIRRYVAEGMPATTVEAPKDPERVQALSAWVRLAERGLLALGYSDFTLRGAPWPPPPMDLAMDPKTASPAQLRTLRDALAIDYCIRAGKLAEDAGPVQALGAVLVAHCAVHVRQRMLATLCPGSAKWDIETPEQFGTRLRELLGFVDGQMARAGAPEDWRKSALDHAWLGGTALLQFWMRIEPRLRAEGSRGLRPLACWG